MEQAMNEGIVSDIDNFMRWAFLIELFGVLGIGRSIWAGAQIGERKGRKWKENPASWVFMLVLPIPFLYFLGDYFGLLENPWPGFYMGLPEVVRWIGFAGSIPACVFLLWVFKTIGKAGAKHIIIFDDMKLATTGPYSRVRHPMYTGFLVWSIMMLLFTDHWGLGGSFIVFLVLIAGVRAPVEEKVLTEQFGDEYRQYMARTNRFLPFGLPNRRQEPNKRLDANT